MEIIFGGILAFLGGGAVKSLIDSLVNRHKNAAVAKSTEAVANLNAVKAANEVVALYGRALEDLQEKVIELETRVASLQDALGRKDLEISMLRAQLEA